MSKWESFSDNADTVILNLKRNIIQRMCRDHYEEIKYILKPRPVVMENIDRLLHCGDPDYGGSLYVCPDCDYIKFVPYRCHSRLCSTCGAIYSMKRAQAMQSIMINAKHRHMVFTIDQNLRHYFLEDRSLLNLLFDAVEDVIAFYFHKLQRKTLHENLTPGFVMVLHTFGRPLEWNPHIHVLCTEGSFDQLGKWHPNHFFAYESLRKSFQKVLLDKLREAIGPSFQKQKYLSYKEHTKGFYVYAQPFKDENGKIQKNEGMSKTQITKYVSRYLGRPVIASSRIDNYDGEHVSWHYNKHEDESLVEVKDMPVLEFLKLVFMHLPEKNFKMIRYGGIYADRCKKRIFVKKYEQKHHIPSFKSWRDNILASFGYDPLKCPRCGTEMNFLVLYFEYKEVPLEELYRKAITKLRSKQAGSSSSKRHLKTVIKAHLHK